MYYLGQNPDIQQRAREEINTVLKGQKITSGDLRSVRLDAWLVLYGAAD
jgi:hypothetical protein